MKQQDNLVEKLILYRTWERAGGTPLVPHTPQPRQIGLWRKLWCRLMGKPTLALELPPPASLPPAPHD